MTLTADILIPVFNRPDAVADLLESLQRHTPPEFVGKILIGNDRSDAFTTEWLKKQSASPLPFEVIHHPQNLGYAGNCNALFAASSAPIAILLNSDTVLPPGWLGRMLAPFEQKKVVLATPLSTEAANHTVRMNEGQSWRDVDDILKALKPTYPDACTAIGFCMGARRSWFTETKQPLFDETFKRGYGEDSDLHYRVLQSGKRSVIVDDLLIKHAGGSSFSQVEDLSSFQSANRALFFQRWEKLHTQEEAKFRLKNELGRVRDAKTLTVNRRYAKESLDVLFILPGMARRYGGIRVVNALCASLLREGLRAAVLTQERIKDEDDLYGLDFTPWQSPENLKHHVEKIGLIVATAHATIPQAEALAKEYGAPFTAFLQGPEIAFGSGARFYHTWEEYQRLPHAICVSDFLVEYLRGYTKAPIDVTRFGPDPLAFYPRELPRQPRSIAIAINKQPEKGSGMALQFGLLAKQLGYHLVLFGFEADEKKLNLPQGFAECLGPLDSAGLAKLFSRVEYIADFSVFEGLGLLPLEAAFCGAIPLLTSKGGPDHIFTDGKNAVFIPSFVSSTALLDRIEKLESSEKSKLQNGAVALCNKVGQRSACEDFLRIVKQRWLKEAFSFNHALVTSSESASFAAVMRDRRHLHKAKEREGHRAYKRDNYYLSNTLTEAREYIRHLEKNLDMMQQSLSWRITQPLRRIKRLLAK